MEREHALTPFRKGLIKEGIMDLMSRMIVDLWHRWGTGEPDCETEVKNKKYQQEASSTQRNYGRLLQEIIRPRWCVGEQFGHLQFQWEVHLY
jgi:hypothetical protein